MRVVLFLCLMISGMALQAEPVLGPNTAEQLIDQGLQSEKLLWLPFPLPYEVERRSNSKDAQLLAALMKYKLVEREKSMVMEDIREQGEARKRLKLLWVYRYPDNKPMLDQEGFYYGRAKLKKIMELSDPYPKGDAFYVRAFVQWYVDDMQRWIKDPAFRVARTLRRSGESFDKPFEKSVYLEYHDGQWRYWQPQAEDGKLAW